MTTVLNMQCPGCGHPFAAYLTKRIMGQILALHASDDDQRQVAQEALAEADAIDLAEEQNGELDDARRTLAMAGLRLVDVRDGPIPCACGHQVDVVELLNVLVRHGTEHLHDENPA